MDDEDNDYELERQKTILSNQALLTELGLDREGSAHLAFPNATSKPAKPVSRQASKKRKAPAAAGGEGIGEGPRRRSGRLLGLEAEGEELAKRVEEEEKEREVLRVINRKTRGRVMEVGDMVEGSSPGGKESLNTYLSSLATTTDNPRRLPDAKQSAKECYAESDTLPAEVQRLKGAFKGMALRANAKVTQERVFSMVVHPEPSKTLVCVGDKYGMLGLWDALGPPEEKVKVEDDDDTNGVNGGGDDEETSEGRIWHVQAHARNSITCMKIDPVAGHSLFSSSYDCSLRQLDFATLRSTELFSFPDEDMLITHFDLVPGGREAWMADKNGGISHVDFRESKGGRGGERRRWVVQEEGRAAKLGGISVNPLMPHLLVTAGNDQHLRIWDTRHLRDITAKNSEKLHVPPLEKESDTASHLDTHPDSSVGYESVAKHMGSAKGKGLMRASWQHGKSCSAAYWDPWGRRILTTSYDDKLRVWTLNPQSLLLDAPLPPTHFNPTKSYPHNCQTGRWLTILRAQWSLNMDYMPHFTVGNMKRTLDVVSATGEKIVSLWTDAVTAVPAVTASHPSHVDHVVGGNTSGRIQLWTAT